MSWHFLQGEEAASWLGNSLDGAPSALSRLIPGHAEYCSIDNATKPSQDFRSGTTSEHSTAAVGEGSLTSSPEDSPARTSASAGPAPDSMGPGLVCGWKWPESFAKFDHASLSWKTRQCSLLGGLEEFSETWPEWGWMRGGECSELQPLERRITEPGFTWLLTPHGSILEGVDIPHPLGADTAQSRRRQFARAVDAAIPADDYAAMSRNPDDVARGMDGLKATGNGWVPAVAARATRSLLTGIN